MSIGIHLIRPEQATTYVVWYNFFSVITRYSYEDSLSIMLAQTGF